jgi:hypothetical protein
MLFICKLDEEEANTSYRKVHTFHSHNGVFSAVRLVALIVLCIFTKLLTALISSPANI